MPTRGIGGLTKKVEKGEAKVILAACNRILGEMREKALRHTMVTDFIVRHLRA